MLTTFDLDEYVYQALRAGASGFLLKTTPPAHLANAVRACAQGETLLSPSVTRQLIETFVQRPGPPSAAPADPQLGASTAREIEVLTALAAGKSNWRSAGRYSSARPPSKRTSRHILCQS